MQTYSLIQEQVIDHQHYTVWISTNQIAISHMEATRERFSSHLVDCSLQVQSRATNSL